MLIGFIKNNRALSIVILPIAIIALWVYGFIYPVAPFSEHATPLYKLIIRGLAGYPFLTTLLSFVLIFCESLLINYIVRKNEIINTTTYLPALTYLILMSLQPEMFSLHPIVLANLFILLAAHKLMRTYRKETAYSEAFDTGLYISIACLFYLPAIVFLLLLWIGLIVIRPFLWREWAISLLGLTLPWIYQAFVYFWIGRLDQFSNESFNYPLFSPDRSTAGISLSPSNLFQMIVLIISFIFTSGRFLRDFNKGTVHLRSNYLLLLYFFLLSIASIFLAPKYSIENLSFLSIPFSVLFSSYLLFTKKLWIAEILFLLLIISVFINQFIP